MTYLRNCKVADCKSEELQKAFLAQLHPYKTRNTFHCAYNIAAVESSCTIQLSTIELTPDAQFDLNELTKKPKTIPECFKYWFKESVKVYFLESSDDQVAIVFLKEEASRLSQWKTFPTPFEGRFQMSPSFREGEITLTIPGLSDEARTEKGSATIFLHSNALVLQFEKLLAMTLPISFPPGITTLIPHLVPYYRQSQFDKTVAVTAFRCSVTLCAHRGSDNNHAFVAVEGLDSGWLEQMFINEVPEQYRRHYFKLFFHFTGDRIEVRFPEKIRITERGEIALLDTEKVKKMLEFVSNERKKDPPRFNPRGRDAWFAGANGGENCFTWARTALKIIEIDLGKSFWGFIATGTRAWTKKPKNIPPKHEGM